MAVELETLYEEVRPKYRIKLHTTSCFGRKIGWIHMVEETVFAPLLHGDELVFNSGLNYSSEEWLKNFIESLKKMHAGGLIIALKEGHSYSEEIIDYCNQIQFPLFSASWDTPYVDIMRMFSEILLRNEQKETNLLTAFRNAVAYPENVELYRSQFELHGYSREMSYTVVVLSCSAYNTDAGNDMLRMIEKSLRYIMKKGVVDEKNGKLIILAVGYHMSRIRKDFEQLCERNPKVYAGVGTSGRIQDIHRSYANACIAYRLTGDAIPKNLLFYEELGIYKILADRKEASIYPGFVTETFGELIAYDRKNQTGYLKLLEAYFENECSILNTAKALYCHKNTITYKLNKLKEILGYDIMSNESRMRIMVAFHIRKLEQGMKSEI